MGEIRAKAHRRELRKIGIKSGWFAILDDKIVASGKTKEELEKNLNEIVPKDKRDCVYIFKL